jgi:uncharacterized membrane protein
MDKNIKTIINLNLFGVIPVIFVTVFIGIFLERNDFKNALLRNIFLGLLGLLGLLAIMMLYNHFSPATNRGFSYEKEGFQSSSEPVATPTCG